MPRKGRIKPRDEETYYHVMNRVCGEPGHYPFGDVEKAKFISMLKKWTSFFTVEVMGFQIMGNHYHITCYAPAEVLSPAATAERYNRFYDGTKPTLHSDAPDCAEVAESMRDISCFMGRLQQQFSTWFNGSRPKRRRGSLWAGRFKSTILERDTALWECLCYIEMNAVRAGLAKDAADYRFGSWGEWCGTGCHPFADNLLKHLLAYEGSEARATTLEEIQTRFRVDLARRTALENPTSTAEIEDAMAVAAQRPRFIVRLDRRIRYWSDGLVIGSKLFVQKMAARGDGIEKALRHRLQRAKRSGNDIDLWSYRRLNSIQD